MEHTHDLAILDRILDRGLCSGHGDGKTTFCAEQAVAVICGLPVTDHPDECVTPAVSAFGRRLNDGRWADEKVRAAGMRDFLIAQIGSKGVVDGKEFARRIALETTRRVLPLWLRSAKLDESFVVACEQAKNLKAARVAGRAAQKEAWKKRNAAAAAAYAAAAYAAAYADAAASAAADAAAAADAYAYAADARVRPKALPLAA